MSAKLQFFCCGVALSLLGFACTNHLNPVPDLNKQKAESHLANRPIQTLADDGTVPVAAGAVAAKSPIDEKYEMFCASCHGVTGHGDGAGAAALEPKPRNFTDKAWQAKVDDARIHKVIAEGGASVGLAPTMAPWGSVLSAEELTAMVAKIRAFGQ